MKSRKFLLFWILFHQKTKGQKHEPFFSFPVAEKKQAHLFFNPRLIFFHRNPYPVFQLVPLLASESQQPGLLFAYLLQIWKSMSSIMFSGREQLFHQRYLENPANGKAWRLRRAIHLQLEYIRYMTSLMIQFGTKARLTFKLTLFTEALLLSLFSHTQLFFTWSLIFLMLRSSDWSWKTEIMLTFSP